MSGAPRRLASERPERGAVLRRQGLQRERAAVLGEPAPGRRADAARGPDRQGGCREPGDRGGDADRARGPRRPRRPSTRVRSRRAARRPRRDREPLRVIPHGVEVFVGLNPIDLRWSFDRLSGIVADRIGREARGGALFLFVGKRRGGMKILFCDGSGLCQFYKRLDRGTFRVPEPTARDATAVAIDETTLDAITHGIVVGPSPPTKAPRALRAHISMLEAAWRRSAPPLRPSAPPSSPSGTAPTRSPLSATNCGPRSCYRRRWSSSAGAPSSPRPSASTRRSSSWSSGPASRADQARREARRRGRRRGRRGRRPPRSSEATAEAKGSAQPGRRTARRGARRALRSRA